MRATTITYLNPAVAVIAGALVLHERVTVWTLVGFALVLGGCLVLSRSRRTPAAAGSRPNGRTASPTDVGCDDIALAETG